LFLLISAFVYTRRYARHFNNPDNCYVYDDMHALPSSFKSRLRQLEEQKKISEPPKGADTTLKQVVRNQEDYDLFYKLEEEAVKLNIEGSSNSLCRKHVVFSVYKCDEMLCDELKNLIEHNSKYSWKHLNPAKLLFVPFPPEKAKCNEFGVPYLGYMYEKMFKLCPNAATYTYVNGDIIVNEQFIDTVDAVLGVFDKDVLLVGQRTNVQWEHGVDVSDPKFSFMDYFRTGTLFNTNAIDYFVVTKKAIDWSAIPRFVIGRAGYDNWLIRHSLSLGDKVAVVDGTNSIPAIHQTDEDGNKAHGGKAVRSDQDKNYNRRLGKCFGGGKTCYSDYLTRIRKDEVIVEERQMYCGILENIEKLKTVILFTIVGEIVFSLRRVALPKISGKYRYE